MTQKNEKMQWRLKWFPRIGIVMMILVMLVFILFFMPQNEQGRVLFNTISCNHTQSTYFTQVIQGYC